MTEANSHGAVNRKFLKDGATIVFSIPLQEPRTSISRQASEHDEEEDEEDE